MRNLNYGLFVAPLVLFLAFAAVINGKGKLLRRCGSCRNFITSNMAQSYGTEKHIGFVGIR